MQAGSGPMIVWAVVLAFLGISTALIAWLIVRLTVGPLSALVVFNAVLVGTYFAIISLTA